MNKNEKCRLKYNSCSCLKMKKVTSTFCLGTAGLFLCVYLIELRFGTRNIIHISGVWHSIPYLGYLIVWNLLVFLEFPITLFFWGEL